MNHEQSERIVDAFESIAFSVSVIAKAQDQFNETDERYRAQMSESESLMNDAYKVSAELSKLEIEQHKRNLEDVQLSFDAAIKIATGCLDYGGGYRGDQVTYGAFQHGIQTVINALNGSKKSNLGDTQSKALYRMGESQIDNESKLDG